jgi:hypothetical protein
MATNSAPWQLFEFVDPWEIWGETLRVELAGADRSGIESVLYDVADYFLKTTGVLRAEMFVDIPAGETDFPINQTFGQDNLIALYTHRVCLGGVWQAPCLPSDMQAARLVSTGPTSAYVVHPQILRVVGSSASTIEKGLGVLLSYKLVRPATCVPRLLSDHYYEAVREGVLGRMKSRARMQYSDAATAALHQRRFQAAIGAARDEARRRWSNAESPHQFNVAWARRPAAGAYMR